MNSFAKIAATALLAMGADARSYYWDQHMWVAGCSFETESDDPVRDPITGKFKLHQLASLTDGLNENPVIFSGSANSVDNYELYDYQVVFDC